MPEYIDPLCLVSVKTMGNIREIGISERQNSKVTIVPLSKEEYVLSSTGEVKKFEHHAVDRTQNLRNLQKTMHQLSDLINANVSVETAPRCLFITLTYRVNQRNTEQVYLDFRNFNKRFKRYIHKQGLRFEYICALEAQQRGSFHLHSIYIFNKKAPFIDSSFLENMWGHGYVSIKSVDSNVDNIGKYFAAYLTDLPDEDENISTELLGGNIKEVLSSGANKRIIKGARLKLIPAGTRIYRYSRGIKKPVVHITTLENAIKEIEDNNYTKVGEYAVEVQDVERAFTNKYIKLTYKKYVRNNKEALKG